MLTKQGRGKVGHVLVCWIVWREGSFLCHCCWPYFAPSHLPWFLTQPLISHPPKTCDFTYLMNMLHLIISTVFFLEFLTCPHCCRESQIALSRHLNTTWTHWGIRLFPNSVGLLSNRFWTGVGNSGWVSKQGLRALSKRLPTAPKHSRANWAIQPSRDSQWQRRTRSGASRERGELSLLMKKARNYDL